MFNFELIICNNCFDIENASYIYIYIYLSVCGVFVNVRKYSLSYYSAGNVYYTKRRSSCEIQEASHRYDAVCTCCALPQRPVLIRRTLAVRIVSSDWHELLLLLELIFCHLHEAFVTRFLFSFACH